MNKPITPKQSQHEIEGEIWRPVPDLEDSFEISNMSRVRNKNTKTIIGSYLCGTKYRFHMLYNRKTKSKLKRYLHRMVAQCFVPNPYKAFEVNHIDGNKLNNSMENLEWVSASQNQLHAIRTGLRTVFFKVGDTNGEKNSSAKLTWDNVDIIRAWYNEKYRTTKDIINKGKEYNVSYRTIYNIVKNISWLEEKRHL